MGRTERVWDRRPCKSLWTRSRPWSRSLQDIDRKSCECFWAHSTLQLARAWCPAPIGAPQVRWTIASGLFVESISSSSLPPCKLFQGFTNHVFEHYGFGIGFPHLFQRFFDILWTIAQIHERRQRVVKSRIFPLPE